MTDTLEKPAEAEKPVAPVEKPLYKLIQPLYADDVYIEAEVRGPMGLEATVIEYDGEPNEAMEPLNEAARAQMLKFFAKLAAGNKAAGRTGDRTPAMGDLVQEAYANRPREMPQRRDDIPPLANTTFENGKFRQPEPTQAVKVITQDKPITVRPRRIMGTSQPEAPLLQTGQET